MSKESSTTTEEITAWPGLPKAMAHRTSVRWLTLESVRVLQDRMLAHGKSCDVLLWTTSGRVQGRLTDIADEYESTVAAARVEEVDIASAAVHVRTGLLNLYEEQDDQLQPIDNGAILHLEDASVKMSGEELRRIPHLAIFASEVVAFTLVPRDGM